MVDATSSVTAPFTNSGAAAAPPGGALDGVPSVPPRHRTLQQPALPGAAQEVAPGLQAVAQVGEDEKKTGTGDSCAVVATAKASRHAVASAVRGRTAMGCCCCGLTAPSLSQFWTTPHTAPQRRTACVAHDARPSTCCAALSGRGAAGWNLRKVSIRNLSDESSRPQFSQGR